MRGKRPSWTGAPAGPVLPGARPERSRRVGFLELKAPGLFGHGTKTQPGKRSRDGAPARRFFSRRRSAGRPPAQSQAIVVHPPTGGILPRRTGSARLNLQGRVIIIIEVVVGATPHPALSKEAVESLFKSIGQPQVVVRDSKAPYRHW